MRCHPPSSTEPASIRSIAATRATELGAILAPDVNAVVWRRRYPGELARACAVLTAHSAPFAVEGALDVERPESILAALEPIADQPTRALLTADVARLIAIYAALLDRRHVWFQLALIATDACRKFHADRVGLRLLCTYAGPGTEWVANANVDRAHVGRAAPDVSIANARIVPDPSSIERAAPGDVLVLKGDAHPGMEARGVVHRSPPIEASGARRLVLKLDAHKCGC